MIRLVIYSPVRLFGEGLAACVGADGGNVYVLAAVWSAERLLALIEAEVPELLLYDVTRREAVMEARRIIEKWPALPVLAVALPEEPVDVVSCAEAGFAGYVPVHASSADLAAIIRASAGGEVVCSPRIAAELMREVRRRPRLDQPATDPLTNREREILALVARGLCNKEIARDLGLSVATVKNHVHHILTKLSVAHRRAAIARVRSEPQIVCVA